MMTLTKTIILRYVTWAWRSGVNFLLHRVRGVALPAGGGEKVGKEKREGETPEAIGSLRSGVATPMHGGLSQPKYGSYVPLNEYLRLMSEEGNKSLVPINWMAIPEVANFIKQLPSI